MRRYVLAFFLVGASACGGVDTVGECGDGELTADEQCDEGALNGDASSCCSATCELAGAATVCRASLGECDAEETCDGVAGSCPADVAAADDTPCSGNGEDMCSAADTCQAGACVDNDTAADTPCGDDPCLVAVCDGAGVCADDEPGALSITIVESQSISAAQNMDVQWLARAESLGHVATIQPQTVLDDIANLDNVDILIHTSHDIPVPAARRATIRAFVESGRGAYIQGEFQAVFEGNQVFEEVVDGLGADFTWGTELTGILAVEAESCFGTAPTVVPTMSQNFGVSGTAVSAGFGAAQEGTDSAGTALPVGFRFCRTGGGLVVTTTDKDNIRAQSAGVPEFMDNVIYRLSFPDTCPL